MRLWGYTNGTRCAREIQPSFDAPALQEFLEDDLYSSTLQVPRLQFFDNRISSIGQILWDECASPDGYSALQGDSLTLALAIDVLRPGRQPRQFLLHNDLALPEVALAAGFSEQSHLTRIFSSILEACPATRRRSQRN